MYVCMFYVYRFNNMLSKYFAVIISLLSYQLILIHSQSMLRYGAINI